MGRPAFDVVEEYLGADNLDQYTFDFKIEALTQLEVVVINELGVETERVRGDDTTYLDSVDFDPVDGGGTVYLQANLPTNHRLFLLLANDEPTQEFQFKNKFDFTLKKLELALDFVVGPIQRLAYLVRRSIKLHEGDDIESFDMTLPPGAANYPGASLAVNDAGTGLQFGATSDEIAEAQAAAEAAIAAQIGAEAAQAAAEDLLELELEGFSARFNEAWSSSGIADAIQQIVDIQYAAPTVSLSATGSSTIREKGDAVTSSTLTAAITKRSDPIAEVRFYDVTGGNTLLDTQTSGGGIPNGGNSTYNWTGSFDDTQQFRAQVDDNGATGGPTTVSSTVTFTFVYPYYYGAGAAALPAANVANLTKHIITSNANLTRIFTPDGTEVLYFAYPASYGALTAVFDVNNFNTINDWTLRTEDITGLDGNPVSYRIYEFVNVPLAGSYDYRFVR